MKGKHSLSRLFQEPEADITEKERRAYDYSVKKLKSKNDKKSYNQKQGGSKENTNIEDLNITEEPVVDATSKEQKFYDNLVKNPKDDKKFNNKKYGRLKEYMVAEHTGVIDEIREEEEQRKQAELLEILEDIEADGCFSDSPDESGSSENDEWSADECPSDTDEDSLELDEPVKAQPLGEKSSRTPSPQFGRFFENAKAEDEVSKVVTLSNSLN